MINKFNTFSALLLIALSFMGVYFYGVVGAVVARIVYSIVIVIFIILLFLKA